MEHSLRKKKRTRTPRRKETRPDARAAPRAPAPVSKERRRSERLSTRLAAHTLRRGLAHLGTHFKCFQRAGGTATATSSVGAARTAPRRLRFAISPRAASRRVWLEREPVLFPVPGRVRVFES